MSIVQEGPLNYTKHPETFFPLSASGAAMPPYRPTVRSAPAPVTRFHWWLTRCPLRQGLIELRDGRDQVIEGWLRREDALKLYEMAYFARGDVLELGAYHGLSTSILAHALEDAGQGSVYSVDLDPHSLALAGQTLISQRLRGRVHFVCSDAVGFVAGLAHLARRFAFVFVDHSHAYAPVYGVCRRLGQILIPGGFCLFHDFNDTRNAESDDDYAVYQAVLAGLDPDQFEFYGVYGCTALYRRR